MPFGALFALLWQGLPGEGTTAAVIATVVLMAYNTAYTAVAVPYGALTPVLTQDYDERTGLNAARMGWSMLGGLIAGIAMPVLIKQTGGYAVPGALLGAALVLPVFVTFAATSGRDQAVVTPGTAGLRAVLAVPAFRRTAVIFACAWSSIAVLSALVPFYVEWHLEAPQALDALLAAIQLSAMASIPVVAWAASKGEKHRTFAVSVALWAGAMVALSLVPSGGLTPALLVGLTVGPGVAAAHVLPWAMLPDVIEQDRLATGEERAGAFYGAMTFIEKISTAVALQGMLGALEWVGYVPGGEAQSEAVVTAIRVGIGPVPAVVLICVAVFAWFNPPVTRAQHAAALEKLSS